MRIRVELRNHPPVTLLFAAAVTISAFLMAAPSQAQDIGQLVSVEAGKCLQPANGSSKAGELIVQEPCNGSPSQYWALQRHHPGNGILTAVWYYVVNQSNNLCLDARGNAVNGTPIQQWPCTGISDEKWNPTHCSGPTCSVASEIYNSAVPADRKTGTHCLATQGTGDGVSMVLMSCDSGVSSQRWNASWPPGVSTSGSGSSSGSSPSLVVGRPAASALGAYVLPITGSNFGSNEQISATVIWKVNGTQPVSYPLGAVTTNQAGYFKTTFAGNSGSLCPITEPVGTAQPSQTFQVSAKGLKSQKTATQTSAPFTCP